MTDYVTYSQNTGAVRTVVKNSAVAPSVRSGEGVLILDAQGWLDPQGFVTSKTGKSPVVGGKRTDRYALVDINAAKVVQVHYYDPLLDTMPNGMLLVQSDAADIGWNYALGALSP